MSSSWISIKESSQDVCLRFSCMITSNFFLHTWGIISELRVLSTSTIKHKYSSLIYLFTLIVWWSIGDFYLILLFWYISLETRYCSRWIIAEILQTMRHQNVLKCLAWQIYLQSDLFIPELIIESHLYVGEKNLQANERVTGNQITDIWIN